MTSYDKIYDAFLVRVLDDEWGDWAQEEAERDLYALLECALPWFKFPRTSLEHNEDGFVGDLTNEEIQIIASYMKCEWLNRSIMSWENVKPLYTERDFSQANLLDKLNKTLEYERKTAARLESNYYRSIKGSPFNYSDWAGGNS